GYFRSRGTETRRNTDGGCVDSSSGGGPGTALPLALEQDLPAGLLVLLGSDGPRAEELVQDVQLAPDHFGFFVHRPFRFGGGGGGLRGGAASGDGRRRCR